MTSEALNLGNVSLLSLDGVGISTRCRRVVAMTLSLSFAVPETSLVVLVYLRISEKSLLSEKWLFPTRYVSRGGVGGLILFRVLLFPLCRLVSSGAFWVHLAGARSRLEHCFCLCIDRFFNGLFPGVQIPTSGIQLGPDRRLQVFLEISDHDLFVQSGSRVKL